MSTPQRPGWYPAPDGSPGEQWWNGAGWSESRRGAAATPAPPVVSPGRPDPYTLAHHGVKPAAPGQPLAARPVSLATANSAATAALILGLVSFGLPIAGIPAIILGLIGMSRAKVSPTPTIGGKWLALAGVILGAFGLVLGSIPLLIFFAALLDFS